MKLKYYMRGMGVGIVVTSLIFLIAIAFLKPLDKNDVPSSTIRDEQEKTSQETAKEEDAASDKETTVDEDGNVTTVENIPGAEESEADQAAAAAAEEEAKAQKAEAEKKAEEAKKTEEKAAEDKQAETPKTEEKTTSNTASATESITITINGGESSNTVGNKLQQAGAVDSGSRFNRYLEDNNYDNVIHPGTYSVPKGSTYEEIANIITGH